MYRSKKLRLTQPRFEAEDLPDPLSEPKRCLQINKEWIPLLIGNMWWMKGAWAWDGNPTDVETAVQYTQLLMEHFAVGDPNCGDSIGDFTECCNEYFPNSPVFRFAPNDPFQTPDFVPGGGYLLPPWREFGNIEQSIPNTEEGDALVTVETLPFGILNPFDPLAIINFFTNARFPRFKIRFSGSGTVELHLIKVPLGGMGAITVDGNPFSAKFVSLATLNADSITDIVALETIFPVAGLASLIQIEIIEIEVEGQGDHYLDFTIIPTVGTVGPLLTISGFGGGVRKIVLCGDIEAVEEQDMQVRLNGCNFEWRPNSDTEWENLGNPLANMTFSVNTLSPGANATVSVEDCEVTLGIPRGLQGIQGVAGAAGQDGDCPTDCGTPYEQPTHLNYICRAAGIVSEMLVDEIILYIAGDLQGTIGEGLQNNIPLSLRRPGLSLHYHLPLIGSQTRTWLADVYQNGTIKAYIKDRIHCLLYDAWGEDTSLADYIAFGNDQIDLPSGTLEDLFTEAYQVSGNDYAAAYHLIEALYRIIALSFTANPQGYKLAVYYEANISSYTQAENCLPLCYAAYLEPPGVTYFCRAAKRASEFFFAELVRSLFYQGTTFVGLEYQKGLHYSDTDTGINIGSFATVDSTVREWLQNSIYANGTYRTEIQNRVACMLLVYWESDGTLAEFIQSGQAIDLDNVELALVLAYGEVELEAAYDRLTLALLQLIQRAFYLFPTPYTKSTNYWANRSFIDGVEECDCEPVDDEWCHEFDFLVNDGDWEPVLPDYSIYAASGWGQGTAKVSRVGIKYTFATPITPLSLTIQLSEPLNGDTKTVGVYRNTGAFNPGDYQAMGDEDSIVWNFPNDALPVDVILTDFIGDYDYVNGANLTAKIIKFTLRGIGTNPFGTSNC